ncbi:MAG: ABC transporter permease, partial [Cyclobacteriaceae bacterium]
MNNKPALFGLSIIIFASFITLSGYLIMPDRTPDANDGAVQIQQKPPGFTTQILKIRKNTELPGRGLFEVAYGGQESAYTIEPIQSYRVEDFYLYVTPFGLEQEKQYFLPQVVKTFYIGDTSVAALGGDKM